jgi:hypothetical protein
MMCGEIVASIPGTATVAIQLRTKTVTCYTFPENLQVVDAPKASRTFFYSSAL